MRPSGKPGGQPEGVARHQAMDRELRIGAAAGYASPGKLAARRHGARPSNIVRSPEMDWLSVGCLAGRT